MGWNRKFPPLVQAGGIAGTLSRQMARRIQARNLIDVYWGVHDSNAALAAFLGMEEPFTLLSTGTWLVAFAVGSNAQNLDEKRDNLWMVDVFERPVACARFMAGRERECIAGNAPLADRQALRAVLQSGTFALPSFAPGGPFPDLKGAIFGKTPSSESERAAVASLYIALMADTILDSIAAAGPLIVEGPLAEDETTLAALASLRPTQPIHSTTAPCVVRGAARLVFGVDAVPLPELGRIEIDPALTPLMRDIRRRWRQSIKEASSS
jgi:sugar (pentulose or hexulose) kinase